ncbi:hypothetical protein LINPERPRIM_LOCUS35578 [Linum perenne]
MIQLSSGKLQYKRFPISLISLMVME